MQSISNLIKEYKPTETLYKNKRDEIITLMVDEINNLREGTNFKKETKANLAKRINMNVFLKGNENDGELELLYKECHAKNNYSKLYWVLKNK